MWRSFLILLWFLHSSYARRELAVIRNDEDDIDIRSDVDNAPKTARLQTATPKTTKGEVVVEKFVDTLMASEKYLRMIETVEEKLSHLETTLQDRSSAILKYLSEVLRVVKTSPADNILENALRLLKNDLDRLKETMQSQSPGNPTFRAVTEGKHGKRKQEREDNSLWKKEYEDELTDAMLSPKRGNNATRKAESPSFSDNEAVIEKLMDTITASEKYLKKIDSLDFRLNRLDIEIHEKTNIILKQLTEIIKAIQNQTPSDKLEMLDVMKSDIGQIRYTIEQQSSQSKSNVADNSECNLEASLDNRLSFLESHMKSVLTSVEAITTVISEVKNRQRAQNFKKNDNSNNQISQIGNGIDVSTLISEFRRTILEQKARKCDCKVGRVDRSERYPTDCHEIQAQGFNITGIYKIKPEEIEPFYVLCELSSSGGGWTVIQNRYDGTQDFLKNWAEYKHGFGNLAGEFWLGLEKVFYLTNQKLYELRVEMEAQNRQEAAASYSVFTIGPEYEGYRISTLGTFRGSAGDSLSYHAGQKFSTYDMDNDEWKEGSCAVEHGGAWWYKECDKSNLNGKYVSSADESQSIYWISFKGPNSPLFKTRMMIRPLPASRPLDYTGKARAIQDNSKRLKADMKPRIKDPKSAHDTGVGRARPPYRYDDNVQPDAFFPNYA